MPHVSKNKLEREVLQAITERLFHVLSSLNQTQDIAAFMDDLLTKTEKIMLAKRFAIAIMLYKEYPFSVISRLLKVSESTISSMRERIDRGGRGYEMVLGRLDKDKTLERLLQKLNQIVKPFAFPPIAGKGRQRFLKNIRTK